VKSRQSGYAEIVWKNDVVGLEGLRRRGSTGGAGI